MRGDPKIWRRSSNGCLYVKINGKQIPLGTDEAEARVQYHALLADRKPAARGTVKGLVQEFLTWCERERPKSYDWYFQYLDPFMAHVGPALTLANIETDHVDEFVREASSDKTRKRPWKNASKAAAVRAVSRVFGWAKKKKKYKGDNPAANAERPRVNPRGEEAFLSPEQIDKVLNSLEDTDPFKQYIYALLYTGCRPGEARNVEVRHIRLAEKAWVFDAEESKCGKKTGKERIIYLNDDAIALTERARLKAGGSGRLFVNRRGKPLSVAWITTKFRRISNRVGFKVVPYYFRHTFVSNALANDVSPQKVAELAGHSLAMTMTIYNKMRMNRKAMLDAVAQATGQTPGRKLA